jgi:hypothetical protein
LGDESELDVAQLAQARALIGAVARALHSGDEWWRVEAACRMLNAQPEPAVEPERDAPAPEVAPEEQAAVSEPNHDWPQPPERLDTQPPIDDEDPPEECPRALLPMLPVLHGVPEVPAKPTRRRPRADDMGPDLDLPSYAALCAACGVFPEDHQAIERRYGVIDAHDKKQLHGRYRKLFSLVREEQGEWERLVGRYVDWLLERAS